MLLADHEILAAINYDDISIKPFSVDMIQPASVDIHLGYEISRYRSSILLIDPIRGVDKEDIVEVDSLKTNGSFVLNPGEFILGNTLQTIRLGPQYQAQVNGKSSLGRLGLLVHATAGFVDPGFNGELTLEIANLNKHSIILFPTMKIAQLSFNKLFTPAQRPYGSEGLKSHYQFQTGARGPAALEGTNYGS